MDWDNPAAYPYESGSLFLGQHEGQEIGQKCLIAFVPATTHWMKLTLMA